MGNKFELEVLQNKLCSGCGACTMVNESLKVDFDTEGQLIAGYVDDGAEGIESKVCPFSDASEDEDTLGARLFNGLKHAAFVGYYRECYTGYVTAGEFRRNGASGGFGRWLCAELLATDEVDYVIHVVPTPEGNRLFEFTVTSDPHELETSARSAYYPVSMDKALKFISDNPGRYAITAVPCFAKALRNLARVEPIIAERVRYVIGVICGHLKTENFAKALALQVGVQPVEVQAVDFRRKIPGNRANEKGFVATLRDGTETEPVNTRDLIGGNWGHGLFKYRACDYCDDVIAETADIAIGDAWLPEFMDDHAGRSVLVVRNAVIHDILQSAAAAGALQLTSVSPDTVVQSQAGGIRHRNEGLAQRLYDDRRIGLYTPRKRVSPALAKDVVQRYIFRFRVESRERSRFALQECVDVTGQVDRSRFVLSMQEVVRGDKPPLLLRVVSRGQRWLGGARARRNVR